MDGIESPEHESDSASPTAFPPLYATNPKADIDSLSHAFAPGGMTDEAAAMPSPCPFIEKKFDIKTHVIFDEETGNFNIQSTFRFDPQDFGMEVVKDEQ